MSGNVRKNGREVAVVRLASGDTNKEAASACGISERTVYRWLADDTFRAAIREARRQLVGQAAGKLSYHSADAAGRLHQLLSSDSENISLGAARAILEYTIKVREHDDLAAAVEALKADVDRLKADKAGGGA